MDIQAHQILYLGTANRQVHQFAVEGRLCDSQTGAVLYDLTGANREQFAFNTNATLTESQRRKIVKTIAAMLLRMSAGLDPALKD